MERQVNENNADIIDRPTLKTWSTVVKLTSLYLNFLLCKMEIIFIFWDCYRE